jgi:DNA polymerase III subunit gamma/tau
LRDNIKYMPAHSSYKIYIIDEVHMLSMSAFNALLKTLEEPPAHVIFMFATTEPHKIPVTILSRCQRHDFRRIRSDAIIAHLADVCRREDIAITAESLGLIAREAAGSMRDALSLLDQVMTCSEGTIAREQVLDILGVIDRKILFDISDALLRADIALVLDHLNTIYDCGHDIKKFYADLLDHFRNLLVAKIGKNVERLVDLPSAEIEQLTAQAGAFTAADLNRIFNQLFKEEASIRMSIQPKLAMEIAFIRILQTPPALPIDILIDKLDILRNEMLSHAGQKKIAGDHSAPSAAKGDALQDADHFQPSDAVAEREREIEPDARIVPAAIEQPQHVEEIWKTVMDIISRRNPSLAANLTKCRLKNSTAQGLEIEVCGNEFTLKMIQREKNMELLRQICSDFFGKPTEVKLTIADTAANGSLKKKTQDDERKQKALNHPLLADAMDIFNGTLIEIKVLSS